MGRRGSSSSANSELCRASSSSSLPFAGSLVRPQNDAFPGFTGAFDFGSMTPCASPNDDTVFNGEIAGKLRKNLENIWGNKFPSQQVNLYDLDSKAIETLSRLQKRMALEALAAESATMSITIKSQTAKPRKSKLTFKSEELSYATIVLLGVALSGDQKLFAKLIGLALPDTVREISKFLRPPLIDVGDLPGLIHSVARCITHQHNGRSPDPVMLAVEAANAVGVTLDMSSHVDRQGLKRIIASVLKNGHCDKERGCEAGILFAGIEKYVKNGQESRRRKLEKCGLIVDVVCGLLSGIPTGGFLFSAVGALTKAYQERQSLKKDKIELSQIIDAVRMDFNRTIRFPIFQDGKLSIEDDDGNLKDVKVKRQVFCAWYDEIILYNKEGL